MGFNIVLVEPEIPNNTGNIGRLSLASGSTLHLIGPLGFEITDTRLKRAGLDYWQHVDVRIYPNLAAFMAIHQDAHFAFLSSKGTQPHYDMDYRDNMFLVFGKESTGLPADLLAQHPDRLYQIPIFSEHIRSLNLANAVSIIVYDGLRSLRHQGANTQ
ncbi:MAG TPA: tRNA (uridine(34)/cytosine(34)/5-carboxymethylaminomethyluridine(34)-2'-O)-methyltransferase TrmL [Flavobacteriales bacterium]|jgi:tRNA (cytidine/uridine-2'-O-)-methyltransferase|nr:tRNA (uridine(34)/cytosine(34)/5-carboxymethylaminomethyluridine(34)-2'-O)-methyltransferase TrmL [Flavobacteriales bacterium]